jgi:hypothetical protein
MKNRRAEGRTWRKLPLLLLLLLSLALRARVSDAGEIPTCAPGCLTRIRRGRRISPEAGTVGRRRGGGGD